MNFILSQEASSAQKDAITANDKKITVSAGAGTGKTWVLSNRYARLLIDNGELKPAEILTLTFTEAAAAEMKERIIKEIKTKLEKSEEIQRKNEILDGLSDIWISTIHAFAGRLIRESGLSLDIDPTADVITPQQEQEFWESIRNAAEFANLRELARTYGDKTLQKNAKFLDEDKFMTNAVNKWKSNKLSDFARTVAELHASLGNTWQEMLDWSEDDNLIENTRGEIQKFLRNEWRDVWEKIKDFEIPDAQSSSESVVNLIELLNWQKLNSPEELEALKFFYDSIIVNKDKKITGSNAKIFKALTEFLGMSITEWRKNRPKLLKEISPDFDKDFTAEELLMRKTLLKFCAVSWGMWDMMKRRRGLLSFSDMILHARDAIKNKSVQNKFKHILVDEFQDTDPLQFAMIESLIDEDSDINTNLFAVGDIKQSIYKFRHAEPKLFASMINNEDYRNINLDRSFRTRKSLLERFNKIFASLWRGGLGKDEIMSRIKFESLESARDEDVTMPDFKIILALNSKDLSETRKTLAEELAFNISKWVSEGRTIFDKKAKIIRLVKFSDFTVLSRTRSVYPYIEKALDKFNIPSIRDRSEDFFTRGEIGDVVCMLRAAADFSDDFSVMGWLMSPFSGADEDDVINKIFTNAGKKINLIELIKNNLPESYEHLEYLSLTGNNEGAAGLLEIYDKDRRWLSCYLEKDRLRVLRNFRLALSMSRAFQQSGTSSLTACAEWLTRAVKRELKIEEPKWHDENENAVNLTAVHSSKGLEYPVTIIFDTQKKKKSENNPLRPSKDLGLVFSDIPDECITTEEKEKPRLIKWERVISEQGELEEEQRLFYVAATRAQDSLIFCGMTDEEGEPYKDSWTKFLLDNIDDDSKAKIKIAEPAESPEIKEKIESQDEKVTHVNIIQAKNSLRQISASSFSLFEWCPFAWRRRYRQGLILSWELTDRDLEEDKNFIGGADLGSLAHWILSRWPINQNFESELEYYLNDMEMTAKIPAQLRDVWRNKAKKSALREWLLNFASSELGLVLQSNKDIKREYRFMLRLDNKTALAGAIDALYGNNLADYKITAVDNAPSGLYESQLDFYAFIAYELTGQDEIKTVTAFLREGIFKERICRNFEEIKLRISNASETCASGKLNPRFEHCPACPFKKGCAYFK